jgi:hypothetical protein
MHYKVSTYSYLFIFLLCFTGYHSTWRASWLRIVAASGVNFSETVGAGAEFCFSEREFRLNFLP